MNVKFRTSHLDGNADSASGDNDYISEEMYADGIIPKTKIGAILDRYQEFEYSNGPSFFEQPDDPEESPMDDSSMSIPVDESELERSFDGFHLIHTQFTYGEEPAYVHRILPSGRINIQSNEGNRYALKAA